MNKEELTDTMTNDIPNLSETPNVSKKNGKLPQNKNKKLRLYGFIAVAICLGATIAFASYHRYHPRNVAPQSAKLALLAAADNPDAVNILAISAADSVFGKDYLTDDDKVNIGNVMMKINERVMQITNNLDNLDFNNEEVNDLMGRQMAAMAAMRTISHEGIFQKKEKNFNGWKVKIDYESVSENGKKFKSEFWAILDKSGKHVIYSFDIPLV